MREGQERAAALDDFLDLWGKLKSDSEAPGAVIVVEGERDRRALRRLGLEGSILLVHRGESLAATAHRLAGPGRRVIVLTDWDGEGGLFARRLREFLAPEHLLLDLDYRRRLAHILRGELVHVEGLFNWARRLAEREGFSIEQRLAEAGDSRAPTTG